MHDVQNRLNGFRATDLLDLRGERTKIAKLFHNDAKNVFFVVAVHIFGSEDIEVGAINEAYELNSSKYQRMSEREIAGEKMRRRTIAPNDHISAAVFHGISMMTSGLDHIGVPTCVPDVAHFESTG